MSDADFERDVEAAVVARFERTRLMLGTRTILAWLVFRHKMDVLWAAPTEEKGS